MNWYLECLRQYGYLNGRARRSEYWYFNLINLIIVLAIDFIFTPILGFSSIIIIRLYALAVFMPSVAVTVRRLHDIGKSGWFILLALIPLVGAIVLLIFYCTDSEPGENQWGPNPKEE